MKTGIQLLAFFFAFLTSQAAEPVRIQFNCFSLIMHPADVVFGGFEFHNEVTSDPNLPLTNGEVELSEIGQYTHWGYFIMEDELFGGFVYDFVVDIPATDRNNNSTPDIVEFSQSASGRTFGEYFGDEDTGNFRCDWAKDANSHIGTCTIAFDFGPSFTHQFEILEYAGTWDDAVVSENGDGTVNLNLARSGIEGEFLAGPLSFQVGDQRLTLRAASDLKVNGASFKWTADATGNLIAGLIAMFPTLIDGTPSIDPEALNFEDFNEWKVIITDPNDADGDNIPDILEVPTATPTQPTLEILRTAQGLRIRIHGEVGRTYILEDTAAVPASDWLHPVNVVADVVPKEVDLPLPEGATYWRARVLQ